MHELPVNLLVKDRLCAIVGGGKVALRKCLHLLAAGANVKVVSPEICDGFAPLLRARGVEYIDRPFEAGDLNDVALVFACTNDRTVNRRVLCACRASKILCSCVDGNWAQSDFTTPATTRHGELTLAVSTGGQSCRRAKLVKNSLARHIESVETAELVVVGTDHRYMGVSEREPFHLSGDRLDRTGFMLMQLWGVHEFMLLNTCNRIEILAVVSREAASNGILRHALGFDRLHAAQYYELQAKAAWEHAALVCAGMLSQTPGENHVAAQLKEALAFALNKGWAAGMLQEWVASALHVSKHIKNDVVPDIPVYEIEELALKCFLAETPDLHCKTLMVIGCGMVGRGVVTGAVPHAGRIIWCYRNNVPQLQDEWRGIVELCELSTIEKRLSEADVVFCAADAPDFVLHERHAASFVAGKRVRIFDLGMPRNVDPLLNRNRQVSITDLDGLKPYFGCERAGMQAHFARCRGLIQDHAEQYDALVDRFTGGNIQQSS